MNDEEFIIKRVDNVIHELRPDLTRSMASKLIKMGKVTINTKIVTKPSQKVKINDKIIVDYDENEYDPNLEIDIPVIYEDDEVVVINKPLGLLSHAKGNFNKEPTVETWVKSRIKNIEGPRAGIVHRLDRATSGVMILAKTLNAQKKLSKQFANRKVKKTYIAIVDGHLKENEALIDLPIERNPKKPQTFRVGINGKSAQTNYKVLKHNDKYTLVELKPTTGRTHQLRVHLNYLLHPIAGDIIYEGSKQDRMYLHALSLELTLPNSERRTFEAKLPSEFNKLVK
ncbi:MAG: RluA family pseudouridine synthase [bacterium]|nr:RluA family pseudouridine synthase [bacterium]